MSAAFICPACAHINEDPQHVADHFCVRCGRVTLPRPGPVLVPDARALMLSRQDDCLIAIERGDPVPTEKLQALPPWRASMIARIAELAGAGLEQGTAAQVHAEAAAVGGAGTLGAWWEREA